MFDNWMPSLKISGSSKQMMRVFNLAEWPAVPLMYCVTGAPSGPVG